MNALKYLGVLVLLVGVLIMAVPYVTSGGVSNSMLIAGIALVFAGYLGHIFLNRRIR